jgi:hypothetical protein
MSNRNFIWNLVLVGRIIESYVRENPRLVVDWYFPEEELDALIISMGTHELVGLERKYLMYHDLEELSAGDLCNKVLSILERMTKKII